MIFPFRSKYVRGWPFDKHTIGICVSDTKRRFQNLAEKRLEQYPDDLTIIRFRIEDLDFENMQVKGDCLEKKQGVIHQKEGVFPLPGAVYLQCYVEPETVKRIEKLIGRRVFNRFIFNKWECWELLNRDHNLRAFLPQTQKLENNRDLEPFLSIYKDVFLKPVDVIHGHSSKGIFRVKYGKKGRIEVTFRQKGKMKTKIFTDYNECQDWLSRKLSEGYIMQQSIQTLTWQEKVTDIRLNMNKNGEGKWEVSLLLLRVASNDSHITQRITTAMPLSHIIKTFLSGDQNMENIESAVVRLGFRICKCLDKTGQHMADLGIDLGVDEKGYPWIFEVNPLPRPMDNVPDHSLTLPLKYASYLASL